MSKDRRPEALLLTLILWLSGPLAAGELPRGTPEEAGMSRLRLERLDRHIRIML